MVLLEIPENVNPLLVFKRTTKLNELIYMLHKTGASFLQFLRNAFLLGIKYIMSISKLPKVKCYGSVDSYLSNDNVRGAMPKIIS